MELFAKIYKIVFAKKAPSWRKVFIAFVEAFEEGVKIKFELRFYFNSNIKWVNRFNFRLFQPFVKLILHDFLAFNSKEKEK